MEPTTQPDHECTKRETVIIVHAAASWEREDHIALNDYLAAHALLPDEPEAIGEADLTAMFERLASSETPPEEKKGIMVLLAHHKSQRACAELCRYLEKPDPGLERFAKFACDEAVQWVRAAERARRAPAPTPEPEKPAKAARTGRGRRRT